MIDFRYHLVSIVSIFLALAVGIVLGAGPLKEDLGNTLTSEVKNLRTDKAALRTQLDQADKAATARDEFTAASNRTLLPGRLAETTTAIVVLPGADQDAVKATTDALTLAGAKIGSTITVQEKWIDPDQATYRSTLGQQLAGQVGVPVDQGGADVLGQVLARSILAKAGATGNGAEAALGAMRTGDLIKFSDGVIPSTVAVVVAGPVTGANQQTRTTQAEALSTLAGALDQGGAGAVLVADSGPVATGTTSVVTTARADDELSKNLTTVDDVDLPMGQASVVFGLLEQEAGKSGQYGLAADATAAFPQLATK
ncbi:copper transporter [Knoellia koreensis]|uniref:Copper transporter n=1 Tax=Knoellia koreensis TaxID=2730921 RepID=A0A849HDH7_9MICO|nr:copper transporter [Knoellia sp. DB2414S]